MNELEQGFYGSALAYDNALTGASGDLAKVLYRNVYHNEGDEKFSKQLEPFGFFSTHKSHLINLSKVKEYYKEGTVKMTDNSFVPVSKRKKSQFLNQMLLSR